MGARNADPMAGAPSCRNEVSRDPIVIAIVNLSRISPPGQRVVWTFAYVWPPDGSNQFRERRRLARVDP